MTRSAIFLVHLLQDVHVLRPLIFMAARDFGFQAQLLVSDRFRARDTSGVWLREIEAICTQSGAVLHFFGDDWQARAHLEGQGLIFAASESHIHNHSIAHNVFRHAPASFLKVTLQHGFECVGFRHGADHVRAYGETASFAADILCAWYGADHLTALAPSQAPKVVITGPTSVLQMGAGPSASGSRTGLICENLHSLRFEAADKLEKEFLQTFRKFAGAMYRQRRYVRLRPHPGGQYSAKTNAALPHNVQLENAPLYRLDLRQFSYGISPPSSVLIDMLLADIPTAVWRDGRGRIGVGNYEGLTTVSSAHEMIKFAQDAERDRDGHVMHQRRWLEQQGMPLEPADVYARFAQLFEAAERMEVRPPGSRVERERILALTDELAAPLEDSLAAFAATGEIACKVVEARQLAKLDAWETQDEAAHDRAAACLDAHRPSLIILFGQEFKLYKAVLRWAEQQQVPIAYVLNSDGPETSAESEQDIRFEAVAGMRELLHGVDVIYVQTEDLKVRLEQDCPGLRAVFPLREQPELHKLQSVEVSRTELLQIIALCHTARSKHEQRHEK